MPRRAGHSLLILATLLLGAACASTRPSTADRTRDDADEPPAGTVAAGKRAGPNVEFGGSYALPASIRHGSGEVSSWSTRIGVNGGIPAGSLGFIGLQGGYEFGSYSIDDLDEDFDGDDDPIGDVQTLSLTASWFGLLGDDAEKDWGLIVRAGIRSSVETGADFGDGVSGLGMVIAGKQILPGLRAGVGIGVATRLDDDVLVIPALGLDWEITDDLRARIVGPGLELAYRLDDQRSLALLAKYDFRTYRLDGHGPGEDGILEDDRIPVMLRFTQALGENSELRLFLGADVVRRLEVLDEDGDRVDRVSTNPAGILGIGLQIGF